MKASAVSKRGELETAGRDIYEFISKMYPICRSITGDGVRQTIEILKTKIPVDVREVPTGTQVFDWVVPSEWNVRDAYVKNSKGERVIDFHHSNLHLVGYSMPFRGRLSLAELKEHLFSIPEYPDWIPYRHNYYKEDWGFCLSHRELLSLEEGQYDVCIDSSLSNGTLTLAESYQQGSGEDEVLFYAHTCHPSLCNDNLSGIAIGAFLAEWVKSAPRRFSYRFLFCPTTIGSITWLALNEGKAEKIKHGLVLAGLGDAGSFTYKKTRRGNAEIDRIVPHLLSSRGETFDVMEFSPFGYDERQFCSPGFDLPIGCLMRTPNGKYPQYHTSADDLSFIQADKLAESLQACVEIVECIEANDTYVNRNPKCEPQLGRRGLFKPAGREHRPPLDQYALLWVLNLSDGSNSLLDIAIRSGLRFELVREAADALLECGLLSKGGRQDTAV